MATSDCQNCVVEICSKENGYWSTSNSRLSDIECKVNSLQGVHVLFVFADQVRECPACRDRLSALLYIPNDFWTTYYRRSNGYFGCFESYFSNTNTLESYSTWFRFLAKQMLERPTSENKNYVWRKMNILTRWWPSGRTVVVCFDTAPDLRMRFPVPMLDCSEQDMLDPFWIHAQFLDELLVQHDDTVWSIRDLVRETEMIRSPLLVQPNPDYHHLHEIARHAAHSTEIISVAVKTLETMLLQHKNFVSEHGTKKLPVIKSHYNHIRNRLLSQLQMLTSLQYRSLANGQRLQSEITLAFNTVAQYDGKVSVQVARAAQSDSAAMKTIAFLTMIFLPPTFVCALFSMSFFNFTPGEQGRSPKWTVSEHWWIYWATAVPFTVITAIGVWILWQKSKTIKHI